MNFCVKSNGFGKGCGVTALSPSLVLSHNTHTHARTHTHRRTHTHKSEGLGALLCWKNEQSRQKWIRLVKQIWFQF